MRDVHQFSFHLQVYQEMIDRGWRRSGTYCYKPDLKNSCCPQYTIKLDATKFKPTKRQRKVLSRWNRFIVEGRNDDSSMESDGPPSKKAKKNPGFDLVTAVHAAEADWTEGESKHRFETTLEPSTYTDEKFALYGRYQEDIHHDEEKTSSGFERFLVDTPLKREPIPYPATPPKHLPTHYGSYHQLYRLDGELIAMAVLDILPGCVSSVYFMYDKKWEKYSLGKLSAIREVTLAVEICEAGVPSVSSLYMGFYIHSCTKMRYKGEYSPSFLADPVTYQWFPLSECLKQLGKTRYACFSNPAESSAEPPTNTPIYPQVSLPSTEVQEMMVIERIEKRVPVLAPFNVCTISTPSKGI
ncbi:hypothetical protein HGRIS_009738 [Hohenbuehelia grisea]|uniref:Arginyl-tRNA--protein transferase 1 n=1 Tax=Hohenbuehelia grisea TaxID=104357 RepID=A0ABR3J2D4_9AGAR